MMQLIGDSITLIFTHLISAT